MILTICAYCIDGNMPAGNDQVLGEIYERCPICIPACTDCDGLAVFPAAHDCLCCLFVDLLARRLAPILCPGCTGVIAVIDIPTEAI